MKYIYLILVLISCTELLKLWCLYYVNKLIWGPQVRMRGLVSRGANHVIQGLELSVPLMTSVEGRRVEVGG